MAFYKHSFFFLQAEEITLTIGQAFELAYKKFLESRGKDLESKKQSMIMQKRIEILEQENKELKKRLADVAKIKGEVDVKQYMKDNNVSPSYRFFFFQSPIRTMGKRILTLFFMTNSG